LLVSGGAAEISTLLGFLPTRKMAENEGYFEKRDKRKSFGNPGEDRVFFGIVTALEKSKWGR